MDANLEQFLASLQAVNRHLRSSTWDAQRQLPITKVQWLLLRQLQRRGAATIGQLAAHLDVRASTMSQMLDRLERSGYVTREQDESDARVKNIALTEAGRETIRRTEDAWRASLAEPFERLPEEDRDALVRIMRKLSDALPGRGEG
ncbi:MAG TPA: MarR family transcriptional regulator [Paenibacillus sp.]|nr:MarR family transcriptional regulator [Paenibacillus sp.]